jgi:hypothetical protein
MNTKMISFLIAWTFLLTIGCASAEKKRQNADAQFDEIVSLIRAQKPASLIKAQIESLSNACNEGLFGEMERKGTLAIYMGEQIACIDAIPIGGFKDDLGNRFSIESLFALNAVLVCGNRTTPIDALNCLQFNDRHIGKINAADKERLYQRINETIIPFESQSEFDQCIKKFSDELIADGISPHSNVLNSVRGFQSCLTKQKFGVYFNLQEGYTNARAEWEEKHPDLAEKYKEFERSFKSFNVESLAWRFYICSSSTPPKVNSKLRDKKFLPRHDSDHVGFILHQAHRRNIQELSQLRKVMKCDQ